MATLFDGYHLTRDKPRVRKGAPAWDEMFLDIAKPKNPREPYKELFTALAAMSQEELRGRTESLADSYLAQGVTFDFAGEERPFPLDAVPRIILAKDWQRIEKGVQQRVTVLERFLADVYGPQKLHMVATTKMFHHYVAFTLARTLQRFLSAWK